ncbi:MAG: Veg family protein [Christensenellales bacterium]
MKTNLTLNEIKNQIEQIKGKSVKMLVNRGRKRTEKLEGVIQNLYPSVFTVEIKDLKGNCIVSYSYTEVLCGFVKLLK